MTECPFNREYFLRHFGDSWCRQQDACAAANRYAQLTADELVALSADEFTRAFNLNWTAPRDDGPRWITYPEAVQLIPRWDALRVKHAR